MMYFLFEDFGYSDCLVLVLLYKFIEMENRFEGFDSDDDEFNLVF